MIEVVPLQGCWACQSTEPTVLMQACSVHLSSVCPRKLFNCWYHPGPWVAPQDPVSPVLLNTSNRCTMRYVNGHLPTQRSPPSGPKGAFSPVGRRGPALHCPCSEPVAIYHEHCPDSGKQDKSVKKMFCECEDLTAQKPVHWVS